MTKPDDAVPLPQEAEDSSIVGLARAGLEQARETAGKAITATRRKGEAVIEDTREKSMRAAAETNRLFLEHPVAAVAVAAAAGAVLAIFVPRIAIAGKAGRLAGRAVKAAAASDAAQLLATGLRGQGKAVTRTAARKVGTAIGKGIKARRTRKAAVPPEEISAPDEQD